MEKWDSTQVVQFQCFNDLFLNDFFFFANAIASGLESIASNTKREKITMGGSPQKNLKQEFLN